MKLSRKHIFFIILGLLAIDQAVKILVKCNMSLGESIHVLGDWFQIRFIENPGAAFGMELGGKYGKLLLSLFRVGAVCAIGWYIDYLWRHKAPTGVIVGVSMILAGALGNIIDSVLYGVIWDYAPLMYGRVVDMFYFPLFTIHDMPGWLAWLGSPDGSFTFFAPVFNVADSLITVGVIYLLLFKWKYFK